MDKLRPLGCCHVYSARDYTLEAERGSSSDSERGDREHSAAADKKKAGLAPLSVPQSPIFAG